MADTNPVSAMLVANCYHQTARVLNDQFVKPNCPIAATHGVSMILLNALSNELGLKSLYVQETGIEPKRIHALDKLLKQLSPAVQTSLNTRFQRIRQSVGNHAGGTETFEDILATHGDDFVRWRYAHEAFQKRDDGTHGLRIDGIHQLFFTFQAIVEEFQSRNHDSGGRQILSMPRLRYAEA